MVSVEAEEVDIINVCRVHEFDSERVKLTMERSIACTALTTRSYKYIHSMNFSNASGDGKQVDIQGSRAKDTSSMAMAHDPRRNI